MLVLHEVALLILLGRLRLSFAGEPGQAFDLVRAGVAPVQGNLLTVRVFRGLIRDSRDIGLSMRVCGLFAIRDRRGPVSRIERGARSLYSCGMSPMSRIDEGFEGR